MNRNLAIAAAALAITLVGCGGSQPVASTAPPLATETGPSAYSPPPNSIDAVDALVDAGRDEHTRVLSYLLRGTQHSGGLLALDVTIDEVAGECNLEMPEVLDALHPSAVQPAVAYIDADHLAVSDGGYDLPADSADYKKTRTWHFVANTYAASFEGWISLATPPMARSEGWCKALITGEVTLDGSTAQDQVRVSLPSLMLDTRDTLDGSVDNVGWQVHLGKTSSMKLPYGKPIKLPALPGTVLGTYSGIQGYADSYLPGSKASDAQWIAALKKLRDAYNSEWDEQGRELPPIEVCYFHAVVAAADAYGDAGAYIGGLFSQAESGELAGVKKRAREFAKDPSVALRLDVGREVSDAKADCKKAHAET